MRTARANLPVSPVLWGLFRLLLLTVTFLCPEVSGRQFPRRLGEKLTKPAFVGVYRPVFFRDPFGGVA